MKIYGAELLLMLFFMLAPLALELRSDIRKEAVCRMEMSLEIDPGIQLPREYASSLADLSPAQRKMFPKFLARYRKNIFIELIRINERNEILWFEKDSLRGVYPPSRLGTFRKDFSEFCGSVARDSGKILVSEIKTHPDAGFGIYIALLDAHMAIWQAHPQKARRIYLNSPYFQPRTIREEWIAAKIYHDSLLPYKPWILPGMCGNGLRGGNIDIGPEPGSLSWYIGEIRDYFLIVPDRNGGYYY